MTYVTQPRTRVTGVSAATVAEPLGAVFPALNIQDVLHFICGIKHSMDSRYQQQDML